MSGNFFTVSRDLLNSDQWLSERFSRGQAWIDLIGLARWKRGHTRIKGVRVDLERGQLCWSIAKLSERWKWSRAKTAKFLNELESDQQIVQQKSNVTTVITLVNYDMYQLGATAEQAADGTADRAANVIANRTANLAADLTAKATTDDQRTQQRTGHERRREEREQSGEGRKGKELVAPEPDFDQLVAALPEALRSERVTASLKLWASKRQEPDGRLIGLDPMTLQVQLAKVQSAVGGTLDEPTAFDVIASASVGWKSLRPPTTIVGDDSALMTKEQRLAADVAAMMQSEGAL